MQQLSNNPILLPSGFRGTLGHSRSGGPLTALSLHATICNCELLAATYILLRDLERSAKKELLDLTFR